jgi:Cu/Ag efflux pump CusA
MPGQPHQLIRRRNNKQRQQRGGDHSTNHRRGDAAFSVDKLDEALYQGAVLRVRPKAMTVAVIIAGLLAIGRACPDAGTATSAYTPPE